MRIYVAFRTDVDPPTKTVRGSFAVLKSLMKGEDEPNVGHEYTVVEYDIKPNLANLCQAVEDVTELPAESATYYRVNEQGQLRQLKD
jgi:hypothetical protein